MKLSIGKGLAQERVLREECEVRNSLGLDAEPRRFSLGLRKPEGADRHVEHMEAIAGRVGGSLPRVNL